MRISVLSVCLFPRWDLLGVCRASSLQQLVPWARTAAVCCSFESLGKFRTGWSWDLGQFSICLSIFLKSWTSSPYLPQPRKQLCSMLSMPLTRAVLARAVCSSGNSRQAPNEAFAPELLRTSEDALLVQPHRLTAHSSRDFLVCRSCCKESCQVWPRICSSSACLRH